MDTTAEAFKLYKMLPMLKTTGKRFFPKEMKKGAFKGPLFLNETSTVSLLHSHDKPIMD